MNKKAEINQAMVAIIVILVLIITAIIYFALMSNNFLSILG